MFCLMIIIYLVKNNCSNIIASKQTEFHDQRDKKLILHLSYKFYIFRDNFRKKNCATNQKQLRKRKKTFLD